LQIVTVLRDLELSENERVVAMRKIRSCLSLSTFTELPGLIYQLVLLAGSDLINVGLTMIFSFFEELENYAEIRGSPFVKMYVTTKSSARKRHA